ncbi:PHP domain-containing protein [Holdemania massiliensis]|uniref:PHP domain-containing protein n=1 Tax=Holdemania massiliensis TaxID=1468449 RepID=UPI0026765A7C|nr:PHP domain-containing protein [Holdemania massiliensis]
MQRIDGHVHLEHGPICAEYIEAFVDAAQKQGLESIQILDHTHRFKEFHPAYRSVIEADPTQAQWLSGKGKFQDSLRDYLALVRAMKQRSWPLEVRFGLEVCYTPESEPFLKEICRGLPLDFLVGSVHSIGGYLYDMSFSQPLLWQKQPHSAIVEQYCECVLKSVQSGLFDQIGHPDTIKMAASDAVMDRKWISRIALEAKCRGVIIECNTGCHWRYAHPDYGLSADWLKMLADLEIPVITASDAHDPCNVNRDLEQARARLLQFGVRCV